jgi:type 1 glutamine amidotransferase
MRSSLFIFIALLAFTKVVAAEDPKPLRVLIITGGCCHDYDHQGQILAHGIKERCNAACTVLQEIDNGTAAKISLYENPNWAKGFDVVIHDECFSDAKEIEWMEKILKPHKEGVPAVMLHCAMHCYRAPTDEWFKFAGITSPGHGSHYAYEVKNLKPAHPIMKGFGEKWQTPKEELYYCDKVWPNATPLGEAFSTNRKANQTCIWTNMYGNTRVFGTTIGHFTETVATPQYLDLVTRGLLWTCNKLDDDGKPIAGYEPKKKSL